MTNNYFVLLSVVFLLTACLPFQKGNSMSDALKRPANQSSLKSDLVPPQPPAPEPALSTDDQPQILLIELAPGAAIKLSINTPYSLDGKLLKLNNFTHKSALPGGPQSARAYLSFDKEEFDLNWMTDEKGVETFTKKDIRNHSFRLIKMNYGESIIVDIFK